MKKITCLMLVAIVACGMASCNKYDSTPEGATLVKGETFATSMTFYLYGKEVTKIVFQANYSGKKTENATDISKDEDASAWALLDGTTLYIRTQRKQFIANSDCESMFDATKCTAFANVTEIDFGGVLNTEKVENMDWMFDGCVKLTTLNLKGINTTSVTSMSGMFSDCKSMVTLDLTTFNTTNVSSIGYMFYSCHKLESLNLSSFNTSNVTSVRHMFHDCGKDGAGCQVTLSSNFTLNAEMAESYYQDMFTGFNGALFGYTPGTKAIIQDWWFLKDEKYWK